MIGLLKTIVTKLGGIDVSQKNHIDTFTESKIGNIKGEQIAKAKDGSGIWIDFQELGGYNYLNAIVVSTNNIKTKNGCILHFNSEKGSELKLISDTKEIESNFSNVSNRWFTEVCFHITDINIDSITNKSSKTIKLEYKKSVIDFETLK
jgi:hypothetical protein